MPLAGRRVAVAVAAAVAVTVAAAAAAAAVAVFACSETSRAAFQSAASFADAGIHSLPFHIGALPGTAAGVVVPPPADAATSRRSAPTARPALADCRINRALNTPPCVNQQHHASYSTPALADGAGITSLAAARQQTSTQVLARTAGRPRTSAPVGGRRIAARSVESTYSDDADQRGRGEKLHKRAGFTRTKLRLVGHEMIEVLKARPCCAFSVILPLDARSVLRAQRARASV